MFSRLSNPVTLLDQLNALTLQELQEACKNIKFIIDALSIETSQLMSNQREYSSLVVEPSKSKVLAVGELDKQVLQQVLLNKSILVQIINTLCLSEAIVVRNNFSNCLEDIIEEKSLSFPTVTAEKKAKITNHKPVEKSNVSPINLTQIKQRLAKATQEPSVKQAEIKNKLNALISPTKSETALNSKQA